MDIGCNEGQADRLEQMQETERKGEAICFFLCEVEWLLARVFRQILLFASSLLKAQFSLQRISDQT